MSRTTDMTQGKPLSLLLSFGVPLLLGDLCQQLYTMVDSLVVGRLIGVDAFAAVGASAFVSWLAISILMGFLHGFGVLFGQRFGGRDFPGLRRGTAMSILLTAVICGLLTAAGLLSAEPLLRLIRTPKDILPDTLTYLTWILGGLFVTAANRLTGALLMALGDSRTCLMGTVLASAANILLDLLFVGAFRWNVPGAAAATVAAQLVCFLYSFRRLSRIPEARLSKGDFAFDKASAKELLRLGGPLAFRDGIISVGGLFLQNAVNGYGKLFVAGFTAAGKYFGFMQLPAGALDGAFAVYTAQNFGARDLPRIKKGLRIVAAVALISSVVIALPAALFGKPLIALLISGDPETVEAVSRFGQEGLLGIAVGLPLLYLLYLYRSGLQGMGNSLFPMLSGFLELFCRLGSVLLLPGLLGRWSVFLAETFGWAAAFLLLFAAYHAVYRKNRKTLQSEKP